jgi:hypothetical protein
MIARSVGLLAAMVMLVACESHTDEQGTPPTLPENSTPGDLGGGVASASSMPVIPAP